MFRRMGTVGQALLTVFVTVGGLGYAMAQESGESTVDVVKVDPVGARSADKARSPAEQRAAAESAVFVESFDVPEAKGLSKLRARRSRLEAESERLAEESAVEARRLVEAGYSTRDVAVLVGISHQRVSQLSKTG